MKTISAVVCTSVLLAGAGLAQQASITLQNSDVAYCYKQDVSWSLTKSNNHPLAQSGDAVDWTITATKGTPGPKNLCAIGYVSVKNTGTAPATIGNIVVDLQRNLGSPAKWTAISADVADATSGDGATSGNIVAAALQGQTTYTGVATVSGVKATFTENAISGALTFTDANNNTVWSITPQQTIAVGATVNLFYTAVFNVNSLNIPAAEQLRTEVFVSFGNAGARGGSGSTASNIDINGSGTINADEANVRTVPTRVTKALPALQICNDVVTITDEFGSTGTASVSLTSDPIGTGTTTSISYTYTVSGIVSGEGTVSNTAHLDGTDTSVTLTLGPPDPVTGIAPTKEMPCCIAEHKVASSTVTVTLPAPPPGFCSYTQGGFQGGGVPANLLSANFATYFSSGLTIGTMPQYYATWNQLTPLRTWLAGGGPSGALTTNTTNATSTAGGTLAKQTAALTINITLGPVFSNPGIGSLILFGTGTSLDGSSVSQILNAANTALGTGALPSGYTFGALNTLVTNLNESWDNCTQSAWGATHLQ
jgi:hypothetical protein